MNTETLENHIHADGESEAQGAPLMPYYQSHKIVQAVRIKMIEIQHDCVKLQYVLDGVRTVMESLDWYRKHKPLQGWYYVVYSNGYSSASPPDVFESGYKYLPVAGMPFSEALAFLQKGCRCTRARWPHPMFIYLVSASTFQVNRAPLTNFFPLDTDIIYRPHIDIRHQDGSFGVWAPTTDDLIADDWSIAE